ncbi:MAG: hypothetical protein ACLFQZ_14175 [Spirochaetaceae bacterium]
MTVDDALYKKLKDRAYREHKPFKQVVEETLRRGLTVSGQGEKPTRFEVQAHHCGRHTGIDYGKLNQLNDELEASQPYQAYTGDKPDDNP